MRKTYLVQTWGKDGARVDHYEVGLDGPTELANLKKFLKGKYGHVSVTPTTTKGKHRA